MERLKVRRSPESTVHQDSSKLVSRKKKLLLVTTVLVVGLLSVIWARLPWTWTTVDDPKFALWLRALISEHGFILGPAQAISSEAISNYSWGLFAPLWPPYVALTYSLPVGLAHVWRLWIVLAAVAGPIVYVQRRYASKALTVFAVPMAVIACSQLFVGLTILSLQAVSGAACIGVGLMVKGKKIRLIAFIAAAWFSVPYAWLLGGYAIYLWRRGYRSLAVVGGSVSLATFLVGFLYSRQGSYTGRIQGGIHAIADAAWYNSHKLLDWPIVALLSAVLWLALWTGLRLKLAGLSLVLFIGWAGYTTNLLPWSLSGYYMGPVTFLLGISLILAMGRIPSVPNWRLVVALTLPFVIAVAVLGNAGRLTIEWNSGVRETLACLEDTDRSRAYLTGSSIYIATPEAVDQLPRILELSGTSTNAAIEFLDPALLKKGISPQDGSLLLWLGDTAELPAADTPSICRGNVLHAFDFQTYAKDAKIPTGGSPYD